VRTLLNVDNVMMRERQRWPGWWSAISSEYEARDHAL
jgi:hypothetical protein